MVGNINYLYSFGTPHRLTVARPDCSDQTILDVDSNGFSMKWTYESLQPIGAFAVPTVPWSVRLEPKVEGTAFPAGEWKRLNGSLPMLENTYKDARGRFTLTVVGAQSAAVVKVRVENTGERERAFSLNCQLNGWAGVSPAWGDPNKPAHVLVAGARDRADRILAFGIGADTCQISMHHFEMCWQLRPGEIREAYVIRPYQAYLKELDHWMVHDWDKEIEEATREWTTLINSASKLHVPDTELIDVFNACLADLFIMREPFAEGYIASVCGTEVYRNTNPFEPSQVPIALDQLGFHDKAEEGIRFFIDQQEPNGEWTGAQGWTFTMWAGAGFKSRVIMEHYKLTGDRAYLEMAYPHMLASTRWLETMRAGTRQLVDGKRPITYGLMPRGMGDCGLLDDGDHYGVFYPHNVWVVYADKLTLEAAEILGKIEHVDELQHIYETGRNDLLASLERGAIQTELGYRWIPGVPNKTCGSRWGAMHAMFPSGLLPKDHDLINGTIRFMEDQLSLGGLPIDTGWLIGGMWVSAALDDLANAHLIRGNGDLAIEYLYAAINHGTPLVTWCEERGQEPGTQVCTGDRQHLWTPVAVVRVLRNCLIMENGNGLQLALGTSRHWLLSGEVVGITHAKTHFGEISYQLKYDQQSGVITGHVTLIEGKQKQAEWMELQIRLPYNYRIDTVKSLGSFWENETIRWEAPQGTIAVEVAIKRDPLASPSIESGI